MLKLMELTIRLFLRLVRQRSRLPIPLPFLILWTYRSLLGIISIISYPVWMFRRFSQSRSNAAQSPRIGIHTVFIARENILFLKEWILYHKWKGVDSFFLYDNSGSEGFGSDDERPNPHQRKNAVSGHGIPYGDIVALTDAEIADILDHIRLTIPNVHVIEWQPTDKEGRIKFGQEEAHNDALRRFGNSVDWMVFMDMDEFLTSSEPITRIARQLEVGGYDGGIIYDRVMTSRFDHLDRYVTDTSLACQIPPGPPKNICKVSKTWYVTVHSFLSLGRHYKFAEHELFRLHYRVPSSAPHMRDDFEEQDNPIDPEWFYRLAAMDGQYCDLAWKLSVVNPEWKRIMERSGWQNPARKFRSQSQRQPDRT